MSIVDELVTILGFEVDDADAKRFGVTLDRVKRGAFAVGTAVTAAVGAIGVFTKSMAGELDETGKFANSLGLNVEQLQGLEFAIGRAGGSVGDLRGDLASLTKQLASPIPGEFNQALQFVFGINPFDKMTGGLKAADKVLMEVADKLEGLSPQKAQIMAGQLGLSEGTIRLLVQGRTEINRLAKEAGSLGAIIPEQAMIDAASLTDQLYNTSSAIKGLSQTVASGLFPSFTQANTVLNDFIKANKDVIAQNVGSVLRAITDGFDNFVSMVQTGIEYVSKFVPKMDGLTASFNAFEAISGAVTGALIVAAIAMAPIIIKAALIGAAIMGVVVAIQDLIKWFRGVDSVSGTFVNNFLQKYPQVAKLFDSIGGVISSTINLFKSMGPVVDLIGGKIKDMFSSDIGQVFIEMLKNIPLVAVSALTNLYDTFAKFLDLIASLFSGDTSIITKALSALGEQIKTNLSDMMPDWMGKLVNMGSGFFDKVFSTPNERSSTVTNNSSAVTRGGDTYHISVTGGDNPSRTAQAIKAAMQSPMARTVQTGSAGVIR